MNVLALHLWREWREHRFALTSLALALPLMTWLLSQSLSRSVVGDVLFPRAVSLGFVVLLLVTVSGEHLGAERRGGGLRWIERLPSGLGTAFRAKLAFFVPSIVAAAVYGYLVARLIAGLRHTSYIDAKDPDDLLLLLVVLVSILCLWTFATSAWALRGGLALVAAALVLAAIGFPIWRTVCASYEPSMTEVVTMAAMLMVGASSAAWLAFVRGARFGRGVHVSAAFGLAPAAALFVISESWSTVRFTERDEFDAGSAEILMRTPFVTNDGRVAFLFARNGLTRWDSVPTYALRVDLVDGTSEILGTSTRDGDSFTSVDPNQFFASDVFQIDVKESDAPLVFGVDHGESRPFDPIARGVASLMRRGLGLFVPGLRGEPRVIRDPFRGRDYPVAALGEAARDSSLLVRPGRWLWIKGLSWEAFDPDTGDSRLLGWPVWSQPLVLFTDGRILLANSLEVLQVVNPEKGLSSTLDLPGVESWHIFPNPEGARVPAVPRSEADYAGPILLRTSEHAWLVIDEDATSVRRLAIPDSVSFLRRIGRDAAIVEDWEHWRLARLDLVTGEMTTLWPIRPTDTDS